MTTEQFVKGKGQILTEYQRMRKKLGSAVAGRGFSFEPGFMYDAQNELEIDVKTQISELNYQILKEDIDRELKQSGSDYDLAYKNAVIAWELDKQVLLTEWDKELADMKLAMAGDDELIRLVALEVAKRSALLIAAKTVIELEAEAIRKQIAELGGQTGDYEIDLANLKVLTAQKKLDVIPYIQQIIDIENQLIDKELQLVGKAEILVDKAGDVIEKEYEILDKDQQIIQKTLEVAGKIGEITAKDTEIVGKNEELVAIAQLIADKVTEIVAKDALIIAKDTEIVSKESEIITKIETITDRETDNLTKDREVLEELRIIADKTEILTDKESEIVGKNQQLVDKQSVILDKATLEAGKDAEIVTKNEELVTKSEAIADILEDIVAKDTEIIGKNEELITKQETLLGIIEQIADKEAEIVIINEEIVGKQEIIKTKIDTLVTKEGTLADWEDDLKDAQANINTETKTLIGDEQDYITAVKEDLVPEQRLLVTALEEAANLKESLVRPALETLITTMGLYITELAVQQDLYDDISEVKSDIAGIKEEQALKQDTILTKQRELTETVSELIELSEGLVTYKEETLSPVITDYITVLNTYATELAIQISQKEEAMAIRTSTIALEGDKVTGELSVDAAQILLEAQRSALNTAQALIKSQSDLHKVAVSNDETEDITEFVKQWTEDQADILEKRETAFIDIKNITKDTIAEKFDTSVANEIRVDDARQLAHKHDANHYESFKEEAADIKTSEDGVTARLTHLLKQD